MNFVKSSIFYSEQEEKAGHLEHALLILQDGIAVLDKKGIVVYINKAGQDIFKKHLQKFPKIGDSYLHFVQKDRVELTRYYISEALGNKKNVTTINYPQLEKETWFEIEYHPMPDSNGKITHVCIRAKEVTEKIQLLQTLDHKNKAQKSLVVKAAMDAQEKERTGIGRELHDNINQSLTTVKLYNEICSQSKEVNIDLLNKSIQLLNQTINEVRNISKALVAPSSEKIGLEDLIADLVDSINVTTKLQVNYVTQGLTNAYYKSDLQTAVYRIIQEQLTNVLKHAKATSVDVMLLATPENISLQVLDNGVGFDKEQKRKGIGLTNIYSRAELLGGKVYIDSNPGKGCCLMVEFPL